MSKHRDYKTADAPKTEPLKASLSERNKAYEELARRIGEVNKKLAEANELGRKANEELAAALAARKKEQTP